jgi:hypothetical protein
MKPWVDLANANPMPSKKTFTFGGHDKNKLSSKFTKWSWLFNLFGGW